jgi:hypothetical protein
MYLVLIVNTGLQARWSGRDPDALDDQVGLQDQGQPPRNG